MAVVNDGLYNWQVLVEFRMHWQTGGAAAGGASACSVLSAQRFNKRVQHLAEGREEGKGGGEGFQ